MAFGTSGHRGSSLRGSFNEDHILATSQALVEHRRSRGITGPLFLGMDTHALSEPALATALEVFAAHGVEVRIQAGRRYTPTPAISHAILTWNRGRTADLADGVVVTPSHNPPDDGGFKYNPPDGGPAGTDITKAVESRANAILESGLRDVKRVAFEKALRAATDARARLRGPVRRGPGERPRHGRDRRGEAADRRRPSRRRLGRTTGARSPSATASPSTS